MPTLASARSNPSSSPHTAIPPSSTSAGVVLDGAAAASDLGDGFVDGPVWAVPRQISLFTGGAVVFRAAFLEDVGGFDERYFLYYEDVDLALRGGRRGWRFRYEPSSRVWHARSSTTKRLGAEVRRLQERNRIWTAIRFAPPRMVASALWLSVRRLRHHPRGIHLRALLAGIGAAPRLLIERRRHGGAGNVLREAGTRRIERRGVNVVGYHHVSSGLGAVARAIHGSLVAAGVPTQAIDIPATESPMLRAAANGPAELFDTTIVVIAAEALPGLIELRPELRSASDLLIGYFFWELAAAPPTHRYGIELVDEIWASTEFIASAYEHRGRPVYVYSVPLPQPVVAERDALSWRTQLGVTERTFVFLVSFDFFSSVDRKNPFGAIDAFVDAFGSDQSADVRLVVKTINGWLRPDEVSRLMGHVVDTRIVVIDEHVPAERLDALIAAADCFVSLHRGEGLGLHLAAAMWLGTPVIASRYSGNLDFMDDRSAALVDVELVPVDDASGAYGTDGVWASPSRRQAADWMLRLVDDETLAHQLAAAALDRMRDQASAEDFGHQYWSGVHGPRDHADVSPPTRPYHGR